MLSILLALSPDVHALSCFYGLDDVLPADGATDVVLNVQPRVSVIGSPSDGDSILVLVNDETGEIVDTGYERFDNPGNTHMNWLIPTEPLQPMTSYSVVDWVEGDDLLDPRGIVSTFTTGTTLEEGTVESPTIFDLSREKGWSLMWGDWHWIDIFVEDAPISYIVQVASKADFSDAVAVEAFARDENGGAVLAIGSGVCGGDIELDSDANYIQVAAVSMAGEVSPFVEHGKVGCSTAGGRSALPGALLGCMMVSVLRRRRP